MTILAIDPGPTESAVAIIAPTGLPLRVEKTSNGNLLQSMWDYDDYDIDQVAIEMVASYGMPVGADVFETCVWIGRFYAQADHVFQREPLLVKRIPVKTHHCHSAKATDANVRQALVDRFAKGERNHGKGTKADPGWFYGFHRDIWAAYALAVYVADTQPVKAAGSTSPA